MCKSTFQKIRLQNIKKMMHKHPLFPVAFRFFFFFKENFSSEKKLLVFLIHTNLLFKDQIH